jgi:hypothetical protein
MPARKRNPRLHRCLIQPEVEKTLDLDKCPALHVYEAKMPASSATKCLALDERGDFDIDNVVWLNDKDHKLIARPSARHLRSKEVQEPRVAAMIACLLVPCSDSDATLGDLEEKYRKYHKRYGARFARLWYWYQVASLVGPLLRNMLLWLGGLAGLKRTLEWIGRLVGPS